MSAYVIAGLFAAFGGLFVGFVTTTGDAGIGPNYTLNSIAAVVLGGVALRGGVGTLVGAVIGAFILRTIAALMFFSGLPPLAQPLVEGAILAAAIAIAGMVTTPHQTYLLPDPLSNDVAQVVSQAVMNVG